MSISKILETVEVGTSKPLRAPVLRHQHMSHKVLQTGFDLTQSLHPEPQQPRQRPELQSIHKVEMDLKYAIPKSRTKIQAAGQCMEVLRFEL